MNQPRAFDLRAWVQSQILGVVATPRTPRAPAEDLTASERVLLNGSRFAAARQPVRVRNWAYVLVILLAGACFVVAVSEMNLFLAFLGVVMAVYAYWPRPTWHRGTVTPAFDGNGDLAVEEVMFAMIAAALLAREAAVSPTLKKRRNLDGWSTEGRMAVVTGRPGASSG